MSSSFPRFLVESFAAGSEEVSPFAEIREGVFLKESVVEFNDIFLGRMMIQEC